MKIYIAAPMRDTERNKYLKYNFDAFDIVEARLKRYGHSVVSPVQLDRRFEGWGQYPPEDWQPSRADTIRILRRDLLAIEGCDAIYLMRGWQDSSGVRLELAWAENLGLLVFHEEREDFHA